MSSNTDTASETTPNSGSGTYADSHSISLELETLNKQYSNLLTQYRQAVINYADFESNLSSTASPPLTVINGQSFWGTSSITNTSVSTVQECKASCASTSGCTGATYMTSSTSSPVCALRTGEGNLVSRGPNSYAIIPESQELLMEIERLNNLLMQTNQAIQQKIAESKPIYRAELAERNKTQQQLMQEYQELIQEREKTLGLKSQFEDLDEEQSVMLTSLRQNYAMYIYTFIHVIIIIYAIIRFSTIDNLEFNSILGYDTNLFIFCICLILYDVYLFRSNISNALSSLSRIHISMPNFSFMGGLFNSRILFLILVIVLIVVVRKMSSK
jgi:hypothetical protein